VKTNPIADVRRLVNTALQAPGSVVAMPESELDLLVRLLRSVRLYGNLAFDLKEIDQFQHLPEVVRDQFESAFIVAEARARVASWELNRIAWATRDHPGLKIALMKGCAYIAMDLPVARGRIFADVDLLVAEDDIRYFENLLNRRGWKTKELSPYDDNYYRRWTHEIPPLVHLERDVEIDIHHNILPRTARLKPDGSMIFGCVEPSSAFEFSVLCDTDLVLHAMAHLMSNDEMDDKLRDLVDIDNLLRHFSLGDDEFWSRLIRRAQELNLMRPAYYALIFSHELLATPVPANVLDQIRSWGPVAPVNWLMGKMVPRALYPQHPEHPSRVTALARWLLYIRSHWIKMPPWLLAYHLGYQFVIKKFGQNTTPVSAMR
jgi:hypothetical protein